MRFGAKIMPVIIIGLLLTAFLASAGDQIEASPDETSLSGHVAIVTGAQFGGAGGETMAQKKAREERELRLLRFSKDIFSASLERVS
jgi:hypothetical protein